MTLPPRQSALVSMSLAALALGIALASQYLGGLAPCELCHWQRYAHGVAVLVLIPAVLDQNRVLALASLAAGTLAFVVGAGIALFHVGVEQHWWAGLATCSAAKGAGTTEALLQQILATPVVRCDEPQWSFLGISMAGLNGLLTAGLALVTGSALVRNIRA